MSEITKLYENAEVEPKKGKEITIDPTTDKENHHNVCYGYPDFTAGKQIAIENIIFQCNFGVCELQRTMPAEFTKDNRFVKHYFAWQYHAGDIGYYDKTIEEPYGDWDVECSNPDRKEALAGFVNALWDEYLTTEEKQQIKGILE